MGLLGAILFLALSAYLGAAMAERSARRRTAVLYEAAVTESTLLHGIAVRRETLCDTPPELPDGQRAAGRGVWFAASDGFEFLTPDSPELLDPAALREMLERPEQPSDTGKFVAGYDWYFAALVPVDAELPDHGVCRLCFEGTERVVRALVVSHTADAEERCLLLRLTEGGDWLRLRRCTAELIAAEHRGLAVDRSALRVSPEGGQYVELLRDGEIESVPAETEYIGEELVLLRPTEVLREGSRVVLGGDPVQARTEEIQRAWTIWDLSGASRISAGASTQRPERAVGAGRTSSSSARQR